MVCRRPVKALHELIRALLIQEHEIVLSTTENAIEFLISKGFHEDYGARPLRRAIERYIEDPLAEELLRGRFDSSAKVWVDKKEEDEDNLVFLDEAPEKSEPPATAATAD